MLTLDPRRCAVLLLDFTVGIVDQYATDGRGAAATAAGLAQAARQAGAVNVFVIPGQVEADGATTLKTGKPIDTLEPQAGDRLFHKTAIGAFSSGGFEAFLRREGRDTLIVTGIATSGTVLSTTRAAYDLGYRVVVVEDACSDPDADVHALLTRPVHPQSWVGLWRIAEIATAADVVKAMAV